MQMSSSGHIRGFNGLRAIAAFGVIGYHLKLPGFSFGWTGVDLFFVMNGYLITGILIRERERPDYFARFWMRRS
jgi:peptidoglycan/LPS O-acetylase OafA/YrhL